MADHSIAVGVRTDCEALIEAFKETNSLRYEDFATVWKEKRMSFIFCGREDDRELYQLVEESLSIAKNLWLSQRSDDQIKMGGFYLVYAFYMKQPVKSPVKIRLIMNEWESCLMFVSYVIQNEHTDALFIFRTLLRDHAFHFVYLPLEIHIEMDASQQEGAAADESLKFEDRLLEYTKDRNFQQIQAFHEQYHSMKSAIIPQHFSEQPASLAISDSHLILEIKKITEECVTNIQSGIVEERVSHDRPTAAPNQAATTSEDVGQRRARLKKLQFAQPSKSSTRLHNKPKQVEIDEQVSMPKTKKARVKKEYSWSKTVIESSGSDDSSDSNV